MDILLSFAPAGSGAGFFCCGVEAAEFGADKSGVAAKSANESAPGIPGSAEAEFSSAYAGTSMFMSSSFFLVVVSLSLVNCASISPKVIFLTGTSLTGLVVCSAGVTSKVNGSLSGIADAGEAIFSSTIAWASLTAGYFSTSRYALSRSG